MKFKDFTFLFFCSLFTFCVSAQEMRLSDAKATVETKNLYKNLQVLLKKGVMFGHHETLSYGVEWKKADGKRSDVFDVVNDYPAVFGWDLGKIERNRLLNVDGVPFIEMREQIKAVYDMGGINTFSWHMDNPVTLGHHADNTKAVYAILPGGIKNALFNKWLDNAATYLKSLKGSDGKQIPILFRPYHEHNGGWFWWGKDSTSTKEYVDLYRYTVDYLKNKKGVHNLIYVFNTNSFNSASEFTQRYPGDDVIDIMSFDSYQFANPINDANILASKAKYIELMKYDLTVMDSVAKAHNKIAAIAETGFEAIPDAKWWTATLWDTMKDYQISYVMVWRNAGWMEKEKKFHYYAPYPGQISAKDFQDFYQLPNTLFQKDISKYNVYQ